MSNAPPLSRTQFFSEVDAFLIEKAFGSLSQHDEIKPRKVLRILRKRPFIRVHRFRLSSVNAEVALRIETINRPHVHESLLAQGCARNLLSQYGAPSAMKTRVRPASSWMRNRSSLLRNTASPDCSGTTRRYSPPASIGTSRLTTFFMPESSSTSRPAIDFSGGVNDVNARLDRPEAPVLNHRADAHLSVPATP